MKKKLRLAAAILLSVMMLLGTAYAVPDVRAAEVDPTETTAGRYSVVALSSGPIITNGQGQNPGTFAVGEIVYVTLDPSFVGSTYDFVGWVIYGANGAAIDYGPSTTATQITFTMPACNVNVTAMKAENKAKVESSQKESSEAESRSKAESEAARKSREESEAASKSASESASRSEAEASSIEESRKAAEESSRYAAQTIRVGSYDLYLHVSGTVAPEGFTNSKDEDHFSEPVECFYSSRFKTYAYYAKKNSENNYYLYNELKDDLIPFVTFTGAGGVSYLVLAPEHDTELPEEVLKSTTINLSTITSTSSMIVPAWIAKDVEGAERTLLYLASDDGARNFFVYESKNGAVTLTEWEKFNLEETESTEESSEETEEETTEKTTVEETTTAAPEKKGGLMKNYVIWLVIIGAIIALLIAAIVVVFYMGRKQDAEEAALDDDEDPDTETETDEGDGFITGNFEDDFQPYDSSYTRPEQDDLEPFDISFEDAFPDEMGLKKEVDAEAPVQEEVRTPGKLNGTFGGAAAKPLDPDGLTDSELDEYLADDDFEVIDFSRK